jgi:DNA-binding protein
MINLPKSTLANFDQKNGLLDCDRDLYLSIIQFIDTKTLRYYIGLSEECFSRKNHLHYHIYRNKFNRTHIRKLLLPPLDDEVEYRGRAAISLKDIGGFILKEILFENIFELKLGYNSGRYVNVKLINADPNLSKFLNENDGIFLYGSDALLRFYSSSNFPDKWIDISKYRTHTNNVLTIIVDMTQDQNTIYFKIDGNLLPYAVRYTSHLQKRFLVQFRYGEIITLISTTFLKNLPIDKDAQIEYNTLEEKDF